MYLLPLTLAILFLLIDVETIVLRIRSPHVTHQTEIYMWMILQNTAEGHALRQSLEQGHTLRKAVLGMSFGLALVGLLMPSGDTRDFFNRQKIMLLFLLYAMLSVSWSISPHISLRRWVQFAGVLLLAWCAMRSADAPRHTIRILRWGFASALCLSVLLVIVRLDAATDQQGNWIGIFGHKNALGSVSFLAVALWLPSLFSRDSWIERRFAPLILLLAIVSAIQCDHKGAQVCIVVIVSLWGLLKLPLQGTVKLLTTYCIFAIVALCLLTVQGLSLDTLMVEVLGRSSSLTGRVPLWGSLLENFQQHPIFGVGYDAFWTMPNVESLRVIHAIAGWPASHGHNGYIDVLNELGLVGFILLLVILFQALKRAVHSNFRHDSTGMALLLLLFSQLLVNLTESSFCRSTNIVWVMFLLTYVALARVSLNQGIGQSIPLDGGREGHSN